MIKTLGLSVWANFKIHPLVIRSNISYDSFIYSSVSTIHSNAFIIQSLRSFLPVFLVVRKSVPWCASGSCAFRFNVGCGYGAILFGLLCCYCYVFSGLVFSFIRS